MGEKDSLDSKETHTTHLPTHDHLQLDAGEERARFRKQWWQLWLPRNPPPPARGSLDSAPVIPIATASVLSKLTYGWITELMVLGYQRTLQPSDLWKMDPTRESSVLSAKLDDSWARRVKEAESWNLRLLNGDVQPNLLRRMTWAFRNEEARKSSEKRWREVDGRKEASLAWALNDTFGLEFWLGGLYKVLGDTAQLMGPLLVKAIINFGKEHTIAKAHGTKPPSIGRGVVLAIGTFLVTVTASVCQHQFFWRSMSTGVLARAALIGSIYQRGVNLTGKARTNLGHAALVNHISTDVSRVDQCAQWFHAVWTAPIQVTICLIILIVQLGPSALAGFSLFLLIAPIQERVMAYQFHVRGKSMKWTDMRANILLEILGAMRVVKYFSYEKPFLKRIFDIRKNELKGVTVVAFLMSANLAFAFSIPVLAATLAFVTYTLTAHEFDVAVIFASLNLFQLLRQPLIFLPRALSATADARNAIARLKDVFHAELREDVALNVDFEQEAALVVKDATFQWEELPSEDDPDMKSAGKKKGCKAPKNDEKPFEVQSIDIVIPRGQLVAVVGPVGSGKSSLLQGLIGEMRKTQGQISFGGTVGYCPQTAWIQNATLRDNIIFGQDFDEDRYWQAVEVASLLPDLQVLPDGDLTEIGEKGINLSGGQKQRVNIARALYFDADIIILDDPLSAVDAHVGKTLFYDAIIGALRNNGKTIILVTHALHFLSDSDYIYAMNDGRVTEHGTYQQLISNNGEFSRLDKEFGGSKDSEKAEEPTVHSESMSRVNMDSAKEKSAKARRAGAGSGKLEGRLIVKEKRTTGSVSWKVYWAYLVAGRGFLTAPVVFACMVLMQGTQVMNSYTLVWWQANTFHRANSFYQMLYGVLGVSSAIFTLLLGIAMDIMTFFVSQNLHHDSINKIFYAPMSFFDTTPTGRILSVFGKDIDTIDNQLALSMRLLVLTLTNVVGSVIIIAILEHYFLIAAFIVAIGYNYFAAFYRASAREMKRLDSMLRSLLYSHFSESLTGLATIRSYGEMPRFIHENKYYIDLENRALFLTVTNQRWLAIRLDFLGGIMTFIVALLAVVGTSGISPAQIGLVLTYTTSLTQLCGIVMRTSAETENYMEAVERVVYYSTDEGVGQEAPHEIEASKPPPEWPAHGNIEFKNIDMRYRPGLPKVLKGISMKISGGEKIGVVGRTGAGKSSLMLALFRIVELSSGSIHIDGIDIASIGLRDLRTKVAIIPQEPLLFGGTIRSNLDPFSLYDDVRLWDALRRSFLVESSTIEADNSITLDSDAKDSTNRRPSSRFNLDTVIESEGANLSVGERSLLSLARALVKDSKVVVLDEATASVDLETDSKIQQTIQTQFVDRTLLCIAHRLRTIISYDRILVMDSGTIAELGTPVDLFLRQGGIFRGMCEKSNITLDDIRKGIPLS